MPKFESFDGVSITYRDCGEGPSVILLHGAAVDSALNWEVPGLIQRLEECRFRVIAPDARGHGSSDKPHDPHAYAGGALSRDVIALIDHLDLPHVALVGYSMGADTALRVAAQDRRLASVVAGGVGGDLSDPDDYDPTLIAASIRGDTSMTVDSDGGSALGELAKALGGDATALAALVQGVDKQRSPNFHSISCPTLVITGSDDTMSGGSPDSLAARLPNAKAIVLHGCDHLGTAYDPQFTEHVISHLQHHHRRRGGP